MYSLTVLALLDAPKTGGEQTRWNVFTTRVTHPLRHLQVYTKYLPRANSLLPWTTRMPLRLSIKPSTVLRTPSRYYAPMLPSRSLACVENCCGCGRTRPMPQNPSHTVSCYYYCFSGLSHSRIAVQDCFRTITRVAMQERPDGPIADHSIEWHCDCSAWLTFRTLRHLFGVYSDGDG